MISGTTPTFTMRFSDESLDLTQAAHVYVTVADKSGNVMIEKKDADLNVEEKSIGVFLSQEETLGLSGMTTILRANWTYSGGKHPRSCSKGKFIYWEPNELNMELE